MIDWTLSEIFLELSQSNAICRLVYTGDFSFDFRFDFLLLMDVKDYIS